jgi:hypothetical protein
MWHFFSTIEIHANEIGYQSSAQNTDIVKNLLNTAYLWAGVIAVIVIVVAGFMYTMSQDDPGQVTRAKNTLLGAIVGLAIVLFAFVITNTVMNGVLPS